MAFIALVAVMLALPITWPFRYEPAIYAARDAWKRPSGIDCRSSPLARPTLSTDL